MKKFLLLTIPVIIYYGVFSIQAQDGFIIYSDGNGCDRAIKFMSLKNGQFGEEQEAVKKGVSADIWNVISYDGVWLAFGRAAKRFNAKYGECDYHSEGSFDIYIAKIDNGKNLPAEAIKVTHGYWPSWGEDAKYPDKDKTLYYSHRESKSIMKVTIKPDGSSGTPEKHCSVSGPMNMVQASPNGRYYTVRGSDLRVVDSKINKGTIPGAGGKGCHPCWGPRSKYLLWAPTNVCRIEDGKTTMGGKKNGLGKYWFGTSNDVYYDEGKLWAIGRLWPRAGGQNTHGDLGLIEVDISNGGWIPSKQDTVPKFGSSPDVHIFGPDGPPGQTNTLQKIDQTLQKGISYTTQITRGVSGLQLLIESQELTSGYNAALYDLRGKQKVFMKMSGSLKNVLSLNDLVDGRYILKLGNNRISVQRPILVYR